jgi:hypothetical protein
MNPTGLPPARLVCRVVRSARTLLADVGSGHVSTCADCRAFFRATDELELGLRRDAAAIRQSDATPSEGFERSILRAVRESTVPPPAGRSWTTAWATGAVAVAAIAGAVYLQQRPLPVDSIAASPADAAALVDAVENFSSRFTETVIPSAGALVADNPLQRELGSVYSDARSALNFLALNFLPAPASSSSAQPASRI